MAYTPGTAHSYRREQKRQQKLADLQHQLMKSLSKAQTEFQRLRDLGIQMSQLRKDFNMPPENPNDWILSALAELFIKSGDDESLTKFLKQFAVRYDLNISTQRPGFWRVSLDLLVDGQYIQLRPIGASTPVEANQEIEPTRFTGLLYDAEV